MNLKVWKQKVSKMNHRKKKKKKLKRINRALIMSGGTTSSNLIYMSFKSMKKREMGGQKKI